jgi:hypothetical protein
MDYRLPTRSDTILKGLRRFKRPGFKPDAKGILLKRFLGLGLPKGVSVVLSSRRISELRRIEEVVHSVIDCLLTSDWTIFVKERGFLPIIHRIIRKIWSVGAFSLQDLCGFWKSFTLLTLHRGCRSETDQEPELERENIFRPLLSIPWIQKLVRDGASDKRDLEKLSHLVTTRNLPCGDVSALRKALLRFEEITCSFNYVEDQDLSAVQRAAEIIGRKVRKAGHEGGENAHLSLSSAASYRYPIEEGGRAQETVDSITPRLSIAPLEDEAIETPWTVLHCPAGEARWRHWCRDEPFLQFPELQFGMDSPETLAGFPFLKVGFDEAIGSQILACAYLDYVEWRQSDRDEIPVRALAVPEPGYKTRIVTTGPYWLNVLQQAFAHVSRHWLSRHPSAVAGLMRTDQAWQYLYLIDKAVISEGFMTLASDLEQATDAIPIEVAMRLLKGFIDGMGLFSPLYDLAIMLHCSPRKVFVSSNESFVTTRGVLMGEPLAKTVLTLLNLACEELAIREYLKVGLEAPVQVSWRAFAVGGDDHIAYGPPGYLEGITRWHRKLGSLISPTKHSLSSLAVRYCEKILEVRNFGNHVAPWRVNHSTEDYNQSAMVDSIKVRLLSPTSRAIEATNDRNIAIGKGKSLGRTLKWLNPDIFPHKWVQMVRDRFFTRMGPFLPERSSGVYWHLLLPESLGGLGLWLDSDIPDLVHKLPAISRTLLLEIAETEDLNEDQLQRIDLFKGLTSNRSYRGYELSQTACDLAVELLKIVLEIVPSMTWREAKLLSMAPKGSSQKVIASDLRSRQILTLDEISDLIKRPFLFKEILEGKAKVCPYNTEYLKVRFAKLWDLTFSGDQRISEDQIKVALQKDFGGNFYDLGSTSMTMEIAGVMRSVTLIQELTIGTPDLRLQWRELGILM